MKKLVRPLLAGAGVTGALAVTNRALGKAPLPTNALGGTPVPWPWHGSEIFATAAGTAGTRVLLVHGLVPGASSYEYRRLFPLLAERHRVVAFDFLGCGLSAHPRRAYSADLFVEQLADALDHLCGDEPVDVVASSYGAAYAICVATRSANRIARLAAICPAGVTGTNDGVGGGRGAAITALFRAPLVGETAFNVLASRASIRFFLERRAYGDPSHVTPDVVDHYYAVSHQPGARYVPAALYGGALECDVARDLPFLDVPLQLLWGERAPSANPRANADEFMRLARDARVATFARSGLLPHEEEPDAVAETLESFFSAPLMRQRVVDAS